MLQFITFAIIFGIMMFIWSFVYLNKSNDRVNQAFLAFLSVIIIWMVLSISDSSNDVSLFGLIVKTLYFYSMMNMSVSFLYFIYRLIAKKIDVLFYLFTAVNVSTILSRYFFPIDYTDPTFWRLTDPIVAPLMSGIFTLPAIYALFLVIKYYKNASDLKLKAQLRNLFIGIALACAISVLSEYVLPTWFGIDTHLSLMYFAILVFVVYIFISIMKFKFLNIQSEYIYRKLFLNSSDGIIIVNKNLKIVSINNLAKEILHNKNIESGDKIISYISSYNFEKNYRHYEISIRCGDRENYISMTQHPIDPDDKDSEKLLMISDITYTKLKQELEKDLLLKRSSIDLQTGLFNKQYFIDNYYSQEKKWVGRRLVLLFMDIDNFKSINDLYGHLEGDNIVKSVAVCIKSEISNNAQAIRFGGDEFVVVFENTDIDTAYLIAEKIRKKVNFISLPNNDDTLKISMSIGITQGYAPVEVLVIKADKAMYQSKSTGKNRTTIFSENN